MTARITGKADNNLLEKEVYDVDIESLRHLVSNTPGRFDNGFKKKRKLLKRALDSEELSSLIPSKIQISLPFIKTIEDDLDKTKARARDLVIRSQLLEDELKAMKDIEKKNVVIITSELDQVEEEGELDPLLQDKLADLIGVSRREIALIYKLLKDIDEIKEHANLDFMLRRDLNPSNQEQAISKDAAMMVLSSWQDRFTGQEIDHIISRSLIDSGALSYEKLLSGLVKAEVMRRVLGQMTPTSPAFRHRETTRRILGPIRRHNATSSTGSANYGSPTYLSRSRSISWNPSFPLPLPPPPLSGYASPRKELRRIEHEILGLKDDFDKSLDSMNNNKTMVRKNMELVTRTLKTNNERARLLAMELGLQKLALTYQLRQVKARVRAIRKWDAFVQYRRNQEHVVMYLKFHGACKILDAASALRVRRLKYALKGLVRHKARQRELELNCSCIEIQRVVRGFLGRRRHNSIMRSMAAIRIQSFLRGSMRRAKTELIRDELMELNRKTICRQLIIQRAAVDMQRGARGFLARRRVKERRLLIIQEKAALKIQCLVRGVAARVLRAILKEESIQMDAAIKIQKSIRGFNARNRVRDIHDMRSRRIMAEEEEAMMRRRSLRRTSAGKHTYKVDEPRMGLKKKLNSPMRRLSSREDGKKKKRKTVQREEEDPCNALVIVNTMDMDYELPVETKHEPQESLDDFLRGQQELEARAREESVFGSERLGTGKSLKRPKKEKSKAVEEERPPITSFEELAEVTGEYGVIEMGKKVSFPDFVARTMLVQRALRGMIGRRKAKYRRVEIVAEKIISGEIVLDEATGTYKGKGKRPSRNPAERRKTSFIEMNYKAISNKFFKDVEKSHGKQIIKLQSVARMLSAVRRMSQRRKERAIDKARHKADAAATIIQSKVRQLLAMKRVEAILLHLQYLHKVILVQAMVRVFLARRRLLRMREEARLDWQSQYVNQMAAKTIQRYYRGHKVRCTYWYDIQAIKRRMAELKLSRKERAAKTLQCAFRVYRAYRIYSRKKKEYDARREKEEEERRLGVEVEKIHANLERDAKAVIIQCLIRQFLSIRRTRRRRMIWQNRNMMDGERRRGLCAQKIQRVYLGFRARKWFRRNYSRLAMDREDRTYCVECSGHVRNVATKLCRSCKDRYCDSCWKLFHAHGNKRSHTYKTLIGYGEKREVKFNTPVVEVRNDWVNYWDVSNPNLQHEVQVSPNATAQSDWVEYWDSSAQATYFYNVRTGEASWTTPEELDAAVSVGAGPGSSFASYNTAYM